MAFREKLVNDIQTLIKQNKWQQTLGEVLQQILQVRPQNPYKYLNRKISLKSKLDNNKMSVFLAQVSLYCLFINPLIVSEDTIRNKLLYLSIEKHQHVKVRKSECQQIMSMILLDIPQKQKQTFIKKSSSIVDMDTSTVLNINHFTIFLYYTIVYAHIVKEVNQLDLKLGRQGQHLNLQILKQYLMTLDQKSSIMKKLNVVDDLEGQGDLYSILGNFIVNKLNQ